VSQKVALLKLCGRTPLSNSEEVNRREERPWSKKMATVVQNEGLIAQKFERRNKLVSEKSQGNA